MSSCILFSLSSSWLTCERACSASFCAWDNSSCNARSIFLVCESSRVERDDDGWVVEDESRAPLPPRGWLRAFLGCLPPSPPALPSSTPVPVPSSPSPTGGHEAGAAPSSSLSSQQKERKALEEERKSRRRAEIKVQLRGRPKEGDEEAWRESRKEKWKEKLISKEKPGKWKSLGCNHHQITTQKMKNKNDQAKQIGDDDAWLWWKNF